MKDFQKNSSKIKKIIPFHPVFFILVPILHIAVHNVIVDRQIIYAAFIFAGRVMVLGAVLAGILWLIYRDVQKAFLALSLSLAIFFSYGHFHPILSSIPLLVQGWIGPDKVLYSLNISVLICCLIFIYKLGSAMPTVTKIVNFTSGVTFLIVCIGAVISYLPSKLDSNQWVMEKDQERIIKGTQEGKTVSSRPDIYLLILDGYANSQTLKEMYNFSNEEFINSLEYKGFELARKSRSNYMRTEMSLASLFGMEYLPGLHGAERQVPGDDPYYSETLLNMIKDSQVVKYLKQKGYAVYSMGPFQFQGADMAIRQFGLGQDEFKLVMLQTTMLKPFVEKYYSTDMRKSILQTFHDMKPLVLKPGPKFVYMHVMSPHPPFFFNRYGEHSQPPEVQLKGPSWANREGYVEQLRYINSKVDELADHILANASPEPVIIIQGDHGGFSSFHTDHPLKFAKKLEENPGGKQLKECLRIFNAFYLPRNGRKRIYPEITPVNSFRIIFNNYFNENFDLLEDRSYYSTSAKPYDVRDVSAQVQFN